MELKTCNILGLDILVTDMEKTVNLIEQNIEQLRGKYICVGNVHTTVMAHDDPQYHTVQADARVCSAGWRAAFRLQQKTRIPRGGACDRTGSDACIICTR